MNLNGRKMEHSEEGMIRFTVRIFPNACHIYIYIY